MMNKDAPIINSGIIIVEGIRHIGISRTISISKTKKITASKKNRVEKGIRAVFIGSNPHSNGDNLFRSLNLREERTKAARITTIGTKNEIIEKINVNNIY